MAASDDDDDDVSAMWRDWRKMRQEKRASNRENSADLLREVGVSFTEHNIGAHLVVRHNEVVVDFWPGTGRWILRSDDGKPPKGFGVFKLLERLGVKPPNKKSLNAAQPTR